MESLSIHFSVKKLYTTSDISNEFVTIERLG